ncbi:ATP-binding cassette domain-containing protein, partial [Lactococcus lactis]|nr:ATP-binding cassette domain-containing protein [Lactococcus lactis]
MQVKIQNLSKTYKEKQVLQDISFDIKSGTVCGLLGVNGAGKSTLMKILFGLISADTGKIFFDG